MYEKIIYESRGKTSPFIRDKMRISVTDQCNLNCHYCHNEGQEKHGKPTYISTELIDDIVSYCVRGSYHIQKINITGGEPMLHPAIFDIAKKLSSITGVIRLNTNATLLTEQAIRKLVNSGISEFKIGVDSFWSDTQNHQIKTEKLEHIEKIIEIIKALNCSIVINMVITPYNCHMIDQMTDICARLGVSHLKLIEQVPCEPYPYPQSTEKVHKEFVRAYERYREICNRFVPDIDVGMDDMYFDNGFKLRWCTCFCRTRACGTMYSVINAEGNLVVCHKSMEAVKIDFSKEREPKEITKDILAAQNKTCNVAERRYLRDIDGTILSETIPDIKRWDWEQEIADYWKTPEPIVYSLIERWNNAKNVLDLGCGMGRNANVFANAGFEVIAVDNSQFAIDYLQKHSLPSIKAESMDMSFLNLPDNSIDNIFAFNSLSHADDHLLYLAINELYRVLKPGGEAFITLCSKNADGWNDPLSPVVSEHTKLKRKAGPENGVAHYYASLDDILFLFRKFQLLDIQHINHCFYNNTVKNSWHYHILLRKR